ncbi:DUF998 domain-containing protein [Actinopolymorpha sp. NPDC004070]|uniref:DUF998 domain-containing protein n=1 Tax=Actinopolymorpha sp. NPDC004070 TaxID=3154548 RepID=UPI0033B5D15E
MSTVDLPAVTDPSKSCGPASSNVTRSMLGYLALAGPFYVVVSLAQALVRPGFDLSRHEWSLLAVGHHGWIQCANLVLTGLMTIVGGIGAWRALPPTTRGRRWVGALLTAYGTALVGAGVFRADAADGFPLGTPAGRPAQPSPHGLLHLLCGSIGFACLIATCFLVARIYARRSDRRAAAVSVLVGVLFTSAFAGIASGAGNSAVNIVFTLAVIISYAWLTAVAVDLYRLTRRIDREREDADLARRGRLADGQDR